MSLVIRAVGAQLRDSRRHCTASGIAERKSYPVDFWILSIVVAYVVHEPVPLASFGKFAAITCTSAGFVIEATLRPSGTTIAIFQTESGTAMWPVLFMKP